MSRAVPQILAAIKGSSAALLVGDRVYAEHPPQSDEPPYVVITLNNSNAWGTVDNCNPHVYVGRLEVNVIALTRDTAEQIQEVIEDTLVAYVSSPGNLHSIQGITVDGGVAWELLEPKDGSDQFGYWANQDFLVHYVRDSFVIQE